MPFSVLVLPLRVSKRAWTLKTTNCVVEPAFHSQPPCFVSRSVSLPTCPWRFSTPPPPPLKTVFVVCLGGFPEGLLRPAASNS